MQKHIQLGIWRRWNDEYFKQCSLCLGKPYFTASHVRTPTHWAGIRRINPDSWLEKNK
jgi:hypothetical protein